MQTAVEFLFAHLLPFLDWSKREDRIKFRQLEQEALNMEKQQIIDAFDEGQEYEYQYHINNAPKFDSETYYQETFKS